MTQKKEKPEKPKIVIKTRKPEKRGIFDNLDKYRSHDIHPLREILNFPDDQSLDSQKSDSELSKSISTGYLSNQISDSQNQNSGYPEQAILDSHIANTGYPNDENLDSQTENERISDTKTISYPNQTKVDIQNQKSGYPNTNSLDSLIAKDDVRISKKTTDLDSKISKKNNLDSQKAEEKGNWARYEKKRKSKGVFLRTGDEITKRFKQFCIEKDWDFSYGTEIAWNKLMADLAIQNEKDLDSLIALDNRRLKMLWKSRPFIINLYLAYNAIFNEISDKRQKGKWLARWTARDDEAAAHYNETDPKIIELGIIQTQLNKGLGQSKIQTFKYYIDEIEKVLASGVSEEMLETILQYHRNIWKNTTKREIDLTFLERDEN